MTSLPIQLQVNECGLTFLFVGRWVRGRQGEYLPEGDKFMAGALYNRVSSKGK